MAEVVLLGVPVTILLNRFVSVVEAEISLAWGFKAELKTLSAKSAKILALLNDAGTRQVKGDSVTLWLKNLKDAAYDADDVLDDFSFEMLRRKLEKTNRMKNKVSNFFSISNPVAFRFKMAHKVNAINMMLDQVVKEGTELLGLYQVVVQQAPASTSKKFTNRETHPFIDDSKVFGREADQSKVTNMLLNFESVENLSFVAIVGLGGIGKTTLAQLIYKEERVKGHFGKKIWICVSEDFSVRRILKEMAESLGLNIAEMSNIEAMTLRVTEILKGIKYLLVLDDVWNTDAENWNLLRSSLLGINASNGSRVLVTTRSDEVVLAMQTHQYYHLEKLSEEESWSIFHQRAFASGGENETPYLVDIGKRLVKRCGGLPLGLKVLGGMMHSKEEREWISMEESSIWESSYEETGIIPVLRLSFDQLPIWSKQCFAYCSLFPKNFQFEKDNLIQLWIAQGFIQASQESHSVMEEMGDDYFKSLWWISFFHDVRMDIYGCITHCKMHHLVHDLALFVSKSECRALDVNKVNVDAIGVRHLSARENEEIVQTIRKENARRLRTLFMVSHVHDNFLKLKKFKHLRVLMLESSKIKEFPAKIGKLKHLRYLDVSNTEITTFPASLTKLYNLQTLRLMGCKKFDEFPEGIANLVNLRHLYFNYVKKMPSKIGQLTSLQTLLCFRVGKDNGYQIEELGPLSKLRGSVTLLGLELAKGKEEASRAMLREKTNLYELKFVWSGERESADNDEDVLEGLQPPPNLKGLAIVGFWGGKLPSWMTLGTMNNNGLPQSLVKIELRNCKKCEHIPTLGELPFLRSLDISGMHSVKRIGTEFYSKNESGAPRTSGVGSSSQNRGRTLFPALEKLRLKSMDNLVEWTEATSLSLVFPRLQTLGIEKCFKLTTIPSHFPSLVNLIIIDVESEVPIAKICSKVTTLKYVIIENVSELTTLSKNLFRNNKNNITRLSIENCKELSYIPHDGLRMVASSLEYLKIKKCPKLISIPNLQGLTSLQELEIHKCDGVTNLPIGLGTCTSLEKLQVIDCSNLISVSAEDLRELESLSSLTICYCEKLKPLPLEEFLHCLRRLEFLQIGGFSEELESFPFRGYIHQHLQGLKYLTLIGWPKLKSLPYQIRYLSALRELYLLEFVGLKALPEWLGYLSSLRQLGIASKAGYCNNLKYLPSAESIRRLTNLQGLEISGCPLLKERCNNRSRSGEVGTEWSKISHIPLITIDEVVIQDLRASWSPPSNR